MAYTNLTDAQERALVEALNTQFMGMDQNALLKFADVIMGALATTNTSVTNLNSWATATATKLNAQFTAANAETVLPFSPALAVDYDTDPQA